MNDSATGNSMMAISRPGLAMITLQGADAAAFLNAQSMTELASGDADRVRFCAFADARGRVLATAYAWRIPEGWCLAIPAGETAWFEAYVTRFRFRLKVNVMLPQALAVAGLIAPIAPNTWPDVKPMHRIQRGPVQIVRLTNARWMLVGTPTAIAALTAELQPQSGTEALWKRARLGTDEPEIREPTRGLFLPQMLALDMIDAVSFDKGCYPGQEVIARTRNLGQVKRKLALLHTDAAAAPGQTMELAGTRITVLDAAPAPEGGLWVQAIAPLPLPEALRDHLVPAASKRS